MLESHSASDLSAAALGPPGSPDNHLRISPHGTGQFVDSYGRTVVPRGLNVSGCSKLPSTPDGRSHLTEHFYTTHRTVSFIGRPFPLEDADLHFSRLRDWGMTFVRLLVTWESLGHAGPDPDTDLDLEYIAYLKSLVSLMPRYGIKCFICAHQDVWSRFSGGSGAPGWTFEAAGFDIEAFTETGAAYIHGHDEEKTARRLKGEDAEWDSREVSGPFVWPSGYQKLGAATMATLFWGGEALAPKARCQRTRNGQSEDVSIQTFLQDALIEAFGRLADEVAPLGACIGFEAMNEPHRGLINLHHTHGWNYDTDLHIGHYPTFAQTLALGSGYPQDVPFYVKTWPYPTKVSHHSRIDPKGRSAWLLGPAATSAPNRPRGLGECIWRSHGVWTWDEATQSVHIPNPDYFETDHRPGATNGKKIEWYRDFYAPFVSKFQARMHRAKNTAKNMSFVAPIPNEFIPPWQPLSETQHSLTSARKQTYATGTIIDTLRPHNLVYAPHFYDLNVLFNKHHNRLMSVNVQGLSRGMFPLKALHFGQAGLRRNYKRQISNIVTHGHKSLGGAVPTVIGEIGIPFDINGKTAYKTGNYDLQRELLDALISGMEAAVGMDGDKGGVGFTLWNYNPRNNHEFGDEWNKEDFSMVTSERGVGDYRNERFMEMVEDDDDGGKKREGAYAGGRAIGVVVRPYAAKIAGEPGRMRWDERTLRFVFEWTGYKHGNNTSVGVRGGVIDVLEDKSHQTEIFIPEFHYGEHKLVVKVDDADWSYNPALQTLFIRTPGTAKRGHRYKVTVEIRDVQKRLLERVVKRRKALEGTGELTLWRRVLSPEMEVLVEGWLASDDELLLGVLVALLVVLVAVVLGVVLS